MNKLALVTGTTDGIGKHTARRLLLSGYDVIIHGRTQARIDSTTKELVGISSSSRSADTDLLGKVIGAYRADFSELKEVEKLYREIKNDLRGRSIDVVVQNAGVFLQERSLNSKNVELTFQTNVLALYALNCLLWNDSDNTMLSEEARILNVASISQTSTVNLEDLSFNKNWSNHVSYSHSKRCVKNLSFEMFLRMKKGTNKNRMRKIFTLDPGTVNTKMLLSGWGPCGMQIYDANDQFELATNDKFASDDEKYNGAYYVNRKIAEEAKTSEQSRLVWDVCERETGLIFNF